MDLGSNHRRHAPMEPPLTSAEAFTHALAARHRVVLLGGMAIISHGLNRKTKDVDIWLEPLPAAAEWAAVLNECLSSFSEVYPWSLAERRVLMPDEVAEEIEGLAGIELSVVVACLRQIADAGLGGDVAR